MNCTQTPSLALQALSALPTQLASAPAALMALVCICIACLWLLKSSLEADDWSKLPGPRTTLSSVLLNSLGEVRTGRCS